MDAKRLYHTIRLWITRGGGGGRARYLREHHVFRSIGDDVSFMGRVVPLYAELISIGSHVRISSNVLFITHDGIHNVLNPASAEKPEEEKHRFKEALGCIEIGDNVFVGANSMIFYNVKVGNNVIITAGSVVTTDVPSNSVVRGNPAKYVCSFDEYYTLKANKATYPDTMKAVMGKSVEDNLIEWLWDDFRKSRERTS